MPLVTVENIVEKARSAQSIYEASQQEIIDYLVVGLAWSIINPKTNRSLSEQAVKDTGLGNVEDKIIKNHRKTIGLLHDLKNAPSCGIIRNSPEKGLIEIARPVGVIGAITPSTNPIATPLNKILNAIKCRNSIILAPSPKGEKVCQRIVEYLQNTLMNLGQPKNLIQKLPSPINKISTNELMKLVDLVLVTGSQNNVRGAYRSGTPSIGVGAGNVSSIIDETADIEDAAKKIILSKSFDNATSCSSENSIIIIEEIYDKVISALEKNGAVLLNNFQKENLEKNLWINGKLNTNLIAKSAYEISKEINLDRPKIEQIKVLMVEETGKGKNYPFSGEKLCPVLTVYKASNFEDACHQVNDIYNFQGKGHSVGLHTQDENRPSKIGFKLHACRVIVNQAHCTAAGGSFDNSLPFSLSMGCGTWGGNSISENLNYKHFLNIVKVVKTIEPQEPNELDIFSKYWDKYGK